MVILMIQEIRMITEKNLIFENEGVKVVMTHIAGYPGRYNNNAKN